MRRYITNVHDPRTFPIPSIYVAGGISRWPSSSNLKLRLLWSAKQVVILQLWATLIISQAGRAGLKYPLALVQYAPVPMKAGTRVERGRELGFIRPSRRTRIQPLAYLTRRFCPTPPHLKSELVGADALVVARPQRSFATVISAKSLPRPVSTKGLLPFSVCAPHPVVVFFHKNTRSSHNP